MDSFTFIFFKNWQPASYIDWNFLKKIDNEAIDNIQQIADAVQKGP